RSPQRRVTLEHQLGMSVRVDEKTLSLEVGDARAGALSESADPDRIAAGAEVELSMKEPAVHRCDQRIAVGRGCSDGDGLHPIEALDHLLRVERVLPGMDDCAHVRTRSREAAIDQLLELRELRGRLPHVSP